MVDRHWLVVISRTTTTTMPCRPFGTNAALLHAALALPPAPLHVAVFRRSSAPLRRLSSLLLLVSCVASGCGAVVLLLLRVGAGTAQAAAAFLLFGAALLYIFATQAAAHAAMAGWAANGDEARPPAQRPSSEAALWPKPAKWPRPRALVGRTRVSTAASAV